MRNSNAARTNRRPSREKSSFESGARTAPATGNGRYANKDIWCRAWKDRIDLPVCITRSARHPERCAGCQCNL